MALAGHASKCSFPYLFNGKDLINFAELRDYYR